MARQDSYPPWVRQFILPVTFLLLLLSVPYFLRPVARVLLAFFAGILLAIFLDGFAALLRRVALIPRGLALALVLVMIFSSFAGLLWVGGAQVAEQAAGLTERLPVAIETVSSYIGESEWLRPIFSWLSQGGGGTGNILGNVTTVFPPPSSFSPIWSSSLLPASTWPSIRPSTPMPF